MCVNWDQRKSERLSLHQDYLDLDAVIGFDLWSYHVAKDMREITDVFAELVDESIMVAPVAAIYDDRLSRLCVDKAILCSTVTEFHQFPSYKIVASYTVSTFDPGEPDDQNTLTKQFTDGSPGQFSFLMRESSSFSELEVAGQSIRQSLLTSASSSRETSS